MADLASTDAPCDDPGALQVRFASRDGTALARLQLGSPDDRLAARAVARCFVEAAQAGMFGGSRHAPWTCRARLDLQDDRWFVALHDVDFAGASVLMNMVRASSPAARWHWIQPPSGLAGALASPGSQFPGGWPDPPFVVDLDTRDEGSDTLTVRIVVAHPPSDQEYACIERCLRSWTDVVAGKGFSPDLFGEPEVAACEGFEVYALSPFEVEATLRAFDADEAALHGLFGGLAKVAHEGVRISEVRAW